MGKFSLSLEEIEKQISLVDGSKTQAALDNRKNNPQLTALKPNTENTTNKAELPALDSVRPKATFSDWLKGSNTLEQMQSDAELKKKNALQKQAQNAQNPELTADLQKWSNPDYKMTDADKSKFKEYQKNIDLGGTYGYGHADLQGKQLEDFIAVSNKVNKLANFAYGLTDNPLGKLVANTYSNLGTDAEGEEIERLKEGRSNAYTQDILATGAGALAGQMANYNIGSKVAQSIPVLQKASGAIGQGVEKLTKSAKLGKGAQNIFGDMMLDVALDTVPTTIENAQSGMDAGDVAKETAKNLGVNLLFNVGGEGISQIADVLKRKGKITDAEIKNIANTVVSKKYNDFDFEKKSDAQIISERDSLIEQFKRFANGEMRPDEYFIFGDTPKYMSVYGDTEVPLVASQNNLIKSVYPENYMGGKHNVGFDAVADLTRAYNEPVVLMDSLTHPGKGGIVVTDLKDMHTGSPIATPIHMGKDTSMGKVNEIASIQGRHNISNLVDRSNVQYADNQRVHDVLSGNRLQLPNLKESADPMINHSISNPQNNVNPLSKQIQESFSGLKVNDAVKADVDSKMKELYSYVDSVNNTKSKQELLELMDAFNNKTVEIDNLLKGNASYSSMEDNGSKQLFDEFYNALKGKKINISDANMADANYKTIKAINDSIYSGIGSGKFAKNSGTPLDEIFGEIDNEMGGKLSAYMRNGGMNPDNPADQYKGLVEYAQSVKHKDAMTNVETPYDSNMLFGDDVYDAFMKSANEQYNKLNTPSKTMAEDIGLRNTGTPQASSIPETPGDMTLEMRMNKYSNDTAINKADYDDSVKKMLIDEPQLYDAARNVDTVATAEDIMNNNPVEVAYSEFLRRVETKDPVAVALGYRLAKQYGASGNADMAVEIVQKMSSELTKSGQFTQAAAIDLMKENPMAAMRFMEKQINKLNQTGAEKFGKKWTDFKLTDDEVKAFSEIEPNDTEAIKELYENISKRIAKDYPATMWEKVVEASKTAMMLNPRTHLRNVVANAIMTPVRSLSDRVSALGQNAARLFDSSTNVTQSLVGGSKAQKKIADEIFDESIAPLLKKTDKWEEASSNIIRNKQVFDDSKLGKLSKKVSMATLNGVNRLSGGRLEKLVEMADESMTGSIMENLRKFDYWLLGDIEDDIFVKKNFSNRLASYMRAQGINNIDDVPAEAIGISYDEALKATFKDDNSITRAFAGLKKSTGKFGEVLLPFTKTPANIAARGIDYSPAGFINAIKQATNGGTVADVIDTASKASLGTGAIFLGYLLAKEGMIQGALSADKDQQQFEKQQGKQAFSINVNGKYYTYDWAQPAAIPIILGSAIYDGIKESDGEVENLLNIGWQATKAGVDAWAGLSPISSLQDILGGGTYSSDSIAENLFNEVIEFPQRLYPSVLTATAKTIDPTYRQTYTKGDVLQTQIDTLKSKIPVLSKSLPASYDTWGNERKRQDSPESAALANFVNPGTLGYDASTPIDGEINRLFEVTQNKSVFPNKAEWTVKDRYGNNIDLTSQQYSDYQKAMGQTSYRLAEAFIDSDIYNDMSDEDRAGTLSDIYSAVKSMTKNKMFGASVSAENQKVIDAYNANGTQGVINFIRDKHILNSYGLKSNDESSLEFINEHGVDAFKEVSDAIENVGMKQNKENRELYLSGGLPMLKHASNADANNDGKVTKTKELIPYLKMQNWTAEEKNRVVEQFGFSTKNLKW